MCASKTGSGKRETKDAFGGNSRLYIAFSSARVGCLLTPASIGAGGASGPRKQLVVGSFFLAASVSASSVAGLLCRHKLPRHQFTEADNGHEHERGGGDQQQTRHSTPGSTRRASVPPTHADTGHFFVINPHSPSPPPDRAPGAAKGPDGGGTRPAGVEHGQGRLSRGGSRVRQNRHPSWNRGDIACS